MSELTEALDAALAYISDNIPEEYPRDVISYSCLKEIENCPMRWKLRYMDGVKQPQSNAMLVGEAIHKGIEGYYKGGDAEQLALECYRDKVPELTEEARKAKSMTQIQRVARAYVESYPDREHEVSELRTHATLARNIRMEAVTDLLNKGCIIDFKTSSGAHFEPDPLQIVMNALTLHTNEREVDRGEIRQLRKDVTGKMKAYPIVIVHEIPLTPETVKAGAIEIVKRLDDIGARIRLDLWTGPKEDAATTCQYRCSIPQVMVCPAMA